MRLATETDTGDHSAIPKVCLEGSTTKGQVGQVEAELKEPDQFLCAQARAILQGGVSFQPVVCNLCCLLYWYVGK